MVGAIAMAGLGFGSPRELGGSVALGPALSPEGTLARAAARGDRQAFGRLVELHKRSVYGLCLRLLRDPEEARDAAQEAFARSYTALASYDPAQPFAPWILRIARNHCLDLLRRRIPAARRVELDAPEADDAPARELADPEAVPADERLAEAEVERGVEAAVAKLPENYRTVVTLFHVEHLSYKEIAATMEVPMGTVMTWLHRARAQLRAALAEPERKEG